MLLVTSNTEGLDGRGEAAGGKGGPGYLTLGEAGKEMGITADEDGEEVPRLSGAMMSHGRGN